MAEPMDDPDLSGIGAAYRRAVAEEGPPEALDAAILAASRRAVNAGPAIRRRSFVQRWRMPLAAAAVVVVASSLSLLMYDEGRHEGVLRDTPPPMHGVPEKVDSVTAQPQAVPVPEKPAGPQAERAEPVVRMRESSPAATVSPKAPERKAEEARSARQTDRYEGPPASSAPAPAPAPDRSSAQEALRADEAAERDHAADAAKAESPERERAPAPVASVAPPPPTLPPPPAAPVASTEVSRPPGTETPAAPPTRTTGAGTVRGAVESGALAKRGSLSNLRSGERQVSGFSGSPERRVSDASALEGIRQLWESGSMAEARAALDRLRCERPGLVIPPEFPVPHAVLPVCPSVPTTKDAPLPDR